MSSVSRYIDELEAEIVDLKVRLEDLEGQLGEQNEREFFEGFRNGARFSGHAWSQSRNWMAGGWQCHIGLFCHDKAQVITILAALNSMKQYYYNVGAYDE